MTLTYVLEVQDGSKYVYHFYITSTLVSFTHYVSLERIHIESQNARDHTEKIKLRKPYADVKLACELHV